MSTTVNAALDRRAAVRVGAWGAAATALAVGTAPRAGAEAGQAVTVVVLNSVNNQVASYSPTVSGSAWSASVRRSASTSSAVVVTKGPGATSLRST